ncbi:Nuclear migration protein [Pleurostoma richardsiae]|uniref:Nuclear migration protein n=1 Tax=Pleurostoma richardsiae TaxID=41990 RepID=A0AA38VK16_9PEZI|nr:Nuclear migration protein [Pleurostoma richardsiae]
MAAWETEDEYSAPTLPTPSDTPYRTPSRSSKKSRRSVTPPAKRKSVSPPPVPGTDKTDKSSKRSSRDITTDDSISILDPRRFTPTLHANLVSEILSLRRDQEEKLKIIESLETSLQATREEQESLQTTLTTTSKENRSIKRQLALLEGGTSSALGELARERDEAVDTVTETRKRLDVAQKKIRSQEEDSQRVHDLWAKEKDDWEEEKRKYERKIHVAESRLKVVLDEVAAYQAAQVNGQNGAESEVEESAKENDGASIRTMSMTNSIRFSVMNAKPNGHSLADELNFDGDDDWQTDHDGRESVLSNHVPMHMRNASRDSVMSMSRTHRRHHSNDSLIRPGSVARGKFQTQLERLADGIIQEDEEPPSPAPKASYTDTGIQYSPPPSPKRQPSKPASPEPTIMTARMERFQEVEVAPREWEVEANQRRKRVGIARPLAIHPPHHTNLMVSTSSQTVDEPLSPPKTPKSPYQEGPPFPQLPAPAPVEMISSSTQTDPPPLVRDFVMLPVPPEPMQIPSISIHPPTSRPTTPREPRLPQLFKDFGCQVSILTGAPSRSAAVQTEEIRIDTRLDKLPAHLHPSAIVSRPVSPVPETQLPSSEPNHQFTPVPGNLPPRNPRRLASKRSITDLTSSPPAPAALEETHDAYPGNNDDGPLSSQKAPMRRPHRISSLFAGFDGGSSDEVDDFADADLSDSEYRTALSAPSAPRTKPSSRHGKRSSSGTNNTTSPEQSISSRPLARSSMRALGPAEIYTSFSLTEGKEVSGPGPLQPAKAISRSSVLSNRSSGMRKAAMIQNGIATHQGRARSPSLPDARDPPFPIPTRASSRKPPVSVSAPSDGQRSPTQPNGAWHKRGLKQSHSRANSIRKVRSAAALPRNQRYRRQASRSPPPFSPDEGPESPGLPPLPTNDVTTPRERRYKSHHHHPSTNTANTDNTGVQSQNSSNGATGVVDAIAQTMVGEWMYKYVRRRKSFGMPEGTGKDDSSNDRHRRWVWLAPYERSILWSSKQPSNGSALLGKSGRKLTIQSVLDVKDDNPAPKGVPPLFNRSILILTPQRALKFTAVSAERHYLWLTALSFLAHSQQAVPDIVAIQAPKAVPDFEMPRTKLRKPGIRDSIRLAKGKTAVTRSGPVSVASSQTGEVLPSIPDIPSFRPPESFASISTHTRDLSRDAAEAPFIPRFHERANQALVHGRKRSNTGGHVPPPLSFRGFSGPLGTGSSSHHAATNSTAGNSIGTAGSSDIYQTHQSQASSGMASSGLGWSNNLSSAASQRTSEASSRPSGPVMNNFFDAIGTVRMEAFISPLAFSRFDEFPDEQEEMRYRARRRSKEMRRRQSRSRHRDSYQSRSTRGTDEYYGGSRTGGEEEFYLRDDPFKGF